MCGGKGGGVVVLYATNVTIPAGTYQIKVGNDGPIGGRKDVCKGGV